LFRQCSARQKTLICQGKDIHSQISTEYKTEQNILAKGFKHKQKNIRFIVEETNMKTVERITLIGATSIDTNLHQKCQKIFSKNDIYQCFMHLSHAATILIVLGENNF
jgi:hypothetical protein